VWVVLALCILVALTVLVLSIPVDVGLRVEVHGRPAVSSTVTWLFGRVRRQFRSGGGGNEAVGTRERKPEKTEKAEKEPAKRRMPSRKTGRLVLRIVRTAGLVESLRRLLSRVLHCFKVRALFADFRIGLDDPCDTALIVGSVSTAMVWAAAYSPWLVRLSPAFEGGAIFEGEGGFRIRVFPVCLVPAVVAFLFSPSTIRVVFALIRWRLEKK